MAILLLSGAVKDEMLVGNRNSCLVRNDVNASVANGIGEVLVDNSISGIKEEIVRDSEIIAEIFSGIVINIVLVGFLRVYSLDGISGTDI